MKKKNEILRIVCFMFLVFFSQNMLCAQYLTVCEKSIAECISYCEKNGNTLFPDGISNHIIKAHMGYPIKPEAVQALIKIVRRNGEFPRRVALGALSAAFLQSDYEAQTVLNIFSEEANKPNSDLYLLAIDTFLNFHQFPVMQLKESNEDQIDVFLKRLLFWIHDRKNLVCFIEICKKIDDPENKESQKERIKKLLIQLTPELNLCRIARFLRERGFKTFSKKLFEKILANPGGLDHDRVV